MDVFIQFIRTTSLLVFGFIIKDNPVRGNKKQVLNDQIILGEESTQAFEGQPFYIRCSLELKVPYDPDYMESDFIIKHAYSGDCIIEPEFNCKSLEDRPLADRECSCTYDHNGGWFRFFYFIEKINKEIDKEQVIGCSIKRRGKKGKLETKKLLHVWSADPKPGELAKNSQIQYVCKASKVQMTWDFAQDLDGKNKITFTEGSLKYEKFGNRPRTLAKIVRKTVKHKNNIFKSRFMLDNIITDYDGRLGLSEVGKKVAITIDNFLRPDSGKYITTFNYKSDDVVVKLPFIATTTTTTTTAKPSPKPITADPSTSTTSTTITPITTRRRLKSIRIKRQNAANVAQNNVLNETDVKTVLEFTREIRVVTPPSTGSRVKLTSSTTGQEEGGQVEIFICTANNMPRHGDPPVNISIYRGKKVLASRSGLSTINLRKIVTEYEEPFTCRLDGPAIQCIADGDSRRLNSSIIVEKKKEHQNVQLSLKILLYGFTITIVIFEFLWILWIILRQIQIIVTRKKKLEMYQARVLLRHRADELDDLEMVT